MHRAFAPKSASSAAALKCSIFDASAERWLSRVVEQEQNDDQRSQKSQSAQH